MSELLHGVFPWILVPGLLVMVPMVVLRARWGSSSRNARFLKVLTSAAVMMTLTVPAVGATVETWLGFTGIQRLLCDTIALYLSRQAALAIWEETSGSSSGGKRLNVVLTTTSVTGAVVLTASYVAALQAGENLMVIDRESLQPASLTFWVTFCAVHGLNMAFAVGRAMQARWGTRIPTNRHDRASLTWWIVSCLAIWMYILNFPTALLLIAGGRGDHFIVTNTQALQALPGLVGCIAGAICAATWADVGRRLQHLLLRPVWSWSTRTEQDVVLYPLMHHPGHRLARRQTEIALANDRLIAATTADERAQVAAAVEIGGLRPLDGWGLLLHVGRDRRLDGLPSLALTEGEHLPAGPDSALQLVLVAGRRYRYDRFRTKVLARPQPVPAASSGRS